MDLDFQSSVLYESSQELNMKLLFANVGPFDMRHFNSIVLPFKDQCEPHHAHIYVSCSWMGCILGNLLNERTQYGASFPLTSQITKMMRNASPHWHLKRYPFIISLSLSPSVFLVALSSCSSLFFVSFSSVTKAVADTLQAVFLALIMHRCCG